MLFRATVIMLIWPRGIPAGSFEMPHDSILLGKEQYESACLHIAQQAKEVCP